MSKREQKNKEWLDTMNKVMGEMGNVLCEACSVPNWKVYHTPNNPCPKRREETK